MSKISDADASAENQNELPVNVKATPDKADFRTKSAAVIHGTLVFVGTTWWLASVIAEMGSTGPLVVFNFSWVVIGISVALSFFLTFCDRCVHLKQDKLAQDGKDYNIKDVNAPFKFKSNDVLLMGSTLSGALEVAGLFTLVAEIAEQGVIAATGYIFPQELTIGILVTAFLIGVVGALAERRTHRKVLLQCEYEQDKKEKEKSASATEGVEPPRRETSLTTTGHRHFGVFNCFGRGAEGESREVLLGATT